MNRFKHRPLLAALALVLPTLAQAAGDPDLQALREEVRALRAAYEQRIAALEARLALAEGRSERAEASAGEARTLAETAAAPPTASAAGFNPDLSLILSGNYTNLSQSPAERRIQGFVPSGGETMPAARSFNLGESELAISANVDPLFRGDLRLALAPDDTVGVEEASISTLGLGHGFNLKAGRFLSGIGYLNERHPHEWDFSDAPLPYQAFFGNQLGLDGVEVRWLAPTDLYAEFGAEAARARGFPATDAGRDKNGLQSTALFAHVGGDVGDSNSWRAGVSWFGSEPRERRFDDPLSGQAGSFSGRSRTWGADLLWKWAPDGNARATNFKLQGEYFRRTEDGSLTADPGGAANTGGYASRQSGWYLQGVWQFAPTWRFGYRRDQLDAGRIDLGNALAAADLPLLAAYDPKRDTVMVDWSPSEFSRIRLQFARDRSRPDATDNQLWLQYVMSLGAHGAHKF